MLSTARLVIFCTLIATTLAVKCFVCSSKEVDKDATEEYKNQIAYTVRTCQTPGEDTCDDSSAVKTTLTIKDFYLGKACEDFDKKLNSSDSKNLVDCKIGCVTIKSNVEDRDEDKDRLTRQCAYYDEDVTGKYMDEGVFKRTAAGSDKVLNWFDYCKTDYCNGAGRINVYISVPVAVFFGSLARLF